MIMKFCNECGYELLLSIPKGDNRERFVCGNCQAVHYQNPKIVTGCLPIWDKKILLCKRAIEPRYGLWTVPAGFMENGETTHAGAVRETFEEANAKVEIGKLYLTVNLPLINQVYMLFLAKLIDLDFSAGEESLEVDLFSYEDIPWSELAFPTVTLALENYFKDLENGIFIQRMADIEKDSKEEGGYKITLLD
tara:strand:- start:273 stop:851 length:579 start_codon:yes stop_codon:yes gene_type:complete